MCDRIAVMNAGGSNRWHRRSDIYERPATRFVADFVGRSNQIAAARDAAGNPVLGGIAIMAPPTRHPGAIEVFLRPQHIGCGRRKTSIALRGRAGRALTAIPPSTGLPAASRVAANLIAAADERGDETRRRPVVDVAGDATCSIAPRSSRRPGRTR